MSKYLNEAKMLLKAKYSNEEREHAFIDAVIYTSIIYVPIILVVSQIFGLFIMIPYVVTTICLVAGMCYVILLATFYKNILKNIRYVVNMNYNKIIIKGIIIGIIICIAIYLFVIFNIIPTYVL